MSLKASVGPLDNSCVYSPSSSLVSGVICYASPPLRVWR